VSSLFSKQGKPQVQTTTVDPQTQKYLEQIRAYALGNGNSPYQNQFQTALGQAQAGLGALTNPAQAQQFMNPYLSQMNPFFDQMRQRAQQDAMSQATLGGGGITPFDSTRAAVLQGTEMQGVNNLQAQTNYGAFNDAMQRALQGAGQSFDMARYFDPQQYQGRQMGILGMGIGPTGQTTTTPTQRSPLLGGLGGILAGAPLGPGGMIAGGLGGLFGGG